MIQKWLYEFVLVPICVQFLPINYDCADTDHFCPNKLFDYCKNPRYFLVPGKGEESYIKSREAICFNTANLTFRVLRKVCQEVSAQKIRKQNDQVQYYCGHSCCLGKLFFRVLHIAPDRTRNREAYGLFRREPTFLAK